MSGLGYAQAAPDPDKNIVDKFTALYPNADSVRWYEYDTHVTVRFYDQKVLCNLSYDQQGQVVKAIRYYDGGTLSPFYVQRIKDRYPKFDIHMVTETTTDGGTSYRVSLQNPTNWVIIDMDSQGNMQQSGKYKKA